MACEILKAVAKFGTAIIGHYQLIERTGPGAQFGTDIFLRFHTIKRRRIMRHESFAPRRVGQIGREPGLTESHTALAVPVSIPRTMFR
jgi:hypothetical protein